MYYRLCKGLADKGNLIPVNEDIYKYVKDFNKDFYVSLYKYSEEHKRLFDERGSVAGIEDTVTNSLLWDFDSDNPQTAIDDSIKLVERLEENNVDKEQVEIYFSGNKGVHVAVNLEESLTPKEFKTLTKKLARGLKTYDSSVSNPSRIIRVPFTKHQQTGLYKTRITLDELKSGLDYIMQVAKEEYEPVPFNKPIKLPKTIKEYKSEIEKEAKEVTEKKQVTKDTVDLGENPFNLSPWKHALAKGYFPMGDRSNALIILCATYKGKGLDKNDTYYLLKSAADKQSELNSNKKFPKEEIWKNIINVVYNPLWKGGTFTEDNFPESLKDYLMELGIQRAINEDEEADVVSVEESLLGFSKYAENIEENTIKSGIKSLDDKIRLQTGNLYGLLAPPAMGKTSFALELINNTSKFGVDGAFFSYDMAENILTQKLIIREMGYDSEEVFDIFKNRDVEKKKDIVSKLKEEYKNATFCYKTGQTIDQLKYTIRKAERKRGREIKLVIIDYLELILTDFSDPTQGSAAAIQGLREVANSMNKCVFVLLQPNKISSKPNEPLTSYNSAKGSSAIAQAVSAMITCHRPGYSSNEPEKDKFFSINCVKNRMGPLFALDFKWEGRRGLISELQDSERAELRTIREQLRMEKEIESDPFTHN